MARASAKAKQEAVLSNIKEAVSARGYLPSVLEIGGAVGLTSTSTVHGHLSKLEQRGLIRRDATKPHAIEIIDDSFHAQPVQGAIPLLGKVTANSSITAVEDMEEYLQAPPHDRDDRDVFALRVLGDSIIDTGIHDGDLVYVRRQAATDNGDIVVAVTEDDEAAMKRFFKEKNHVRLQRENRTVQPTIFSRVTILGKVIGLWHVAP